MADAEATQAVPRARSRPSEAVNTVTNVSFPLALRGYERTAVDRHLSQLAELVSELEARQLRENVVQRALDEVGEQTSSILQRAHETADEMAAQSRAQAEGRIQRAEREAAITRREADSYAEQIAEDTRQLWEERTRLIEEMRQFAEDVLAVADDALDRLPQPPGADRETDASGPTVVVPDAAAASEAGSTGELEGSGVIEADPPDPPQPGDEPTVEVEALERPSWPEQGRS
jgi:DivIVA domain-containing protein